MVFFRAAIGGVIDGCPAGIELDLHAIQHDLDRRKPGQSAIVTQRKEPDEVAFYSMPIMYTIKSTVFAITVEAEEVLRARPLVG